MQSPSQTQSRRPPTLDTLPSELRRLIVAYLAPSSSEEIKTGCKRYLQNANLAHSCLREWATEYMFRDMRLTLVLPGASCQLEIFAVSPQNARLLNHVKHIVVQVLHIGKLRKKNLIDRSRYHLLSGGRSDRTTHSHST
jgi:hypothetical protein